MLLIALVLAVQTIDVEANARSLCAAEWPTDFEMQDFCMDKQREGMRRFVEIEHDSPRPLRPALVNCVAEWTKAHIVDWQMAAFCADKQQAAYQRLHSDN